MQSRMNISTNCACGHWLNFYQSVRHTQNKSRLLSARVLLILKHEMQLFNWLVCIFRTRWTVLVYMQCFLIRKYPGSEIRVLNSPWTFSFQFSFYVVTFDVRVRAVFFLCLSRNVFVSGSSFSAVNYAKHKTANKS